MDVLCLLITLAFSTKIGKGVNLSIVGPFLGLALGCQIYIYIYQKSISAVKIIIYEVLANKYFIPAGFSKFWIFNIMRYFT